MHCLFCLSQIYLPRNNKHKLKLPEQETWPDPRELKAVFGEVLGAKIDEITLGVPGSLSLWACAPGVKDPKGSPGIFPFWQPSSSTQEKIHLSTTIQ